MPTNKQLIKDVSRHLFDQLTATRDTTLLNIISFTLISYSLIAGFKLYTLAHLIVGFWYSVWFGVIIWWLKHDRSVKKTWSTLSFRFVKVLFSLNSFVILYSILTKSNQTTHYYIILSTILVSVMQVVKNIHDMTKHGPLD